MLAGQSIATIVDALAGRVAAQQISLRSRTRRSAAEKSASLVEELSREITRAVYNDASLAALVQLSKREVERVNRYVDTVLLDLLEISI
jgi:hypothetical protein